MGLRRRRHARLLDRRHAPRPADRATRAATPLSPIPYGGGGFEKREAADDDGGFEHNAERPVGRERAERLPERQVPARDRGGLLRSRAGLQEAGHFIIGSLEGSYDGQAWRSTPQHKFRLKTVGSWAPYKQEGSRPIGGPYAPGADFCSAHYFDVAAAPSPTRGMARARGSWTSRTRRSRGRSRTGGRMIRSSGRRTSAGLRLHRGPRARHRRAEAHVGREAGAQRQARGRAKPMRPRAALPGAARADYRPTPPRAGSAC